ncbi:MAG: 3-oxoacyl-ACP reductase family protein [Pusillimonas sp.]|nr:3-oxoacyl-ACP reductase family protein [Pusillimonas sp.]
MKTGMRTGRLAGRVAIVTGAAQGIGQAYALALGKEGAKVCVSDVADPSETVQKIVEAGGEAIGSRSDVTDQASVDAMVAATMEAFGRVDILINNAALFTTLKMQEFTDIADAEWDRVMAVNVRGTWQCVKAATRAMEKSGGGSIVNVSSATVFKGSPLLAHYVASKGAIVALTRSLARELGPKGIRINAIAPGLVMSTNVEQHVDWKKNAAAIVSGRSLQRDSVPDDLAGTLLFLASEESGFMTGQTLVVDGGIVMH